MQILYTGSLGRAEQGGCVLEIDSAIGAVESSVEFYTQHYKLWKLHGCNARILDTALQFVQIAQMLYFRYWR